MNLDLSQLRVFREVVRQGSYTAAARHLHVTQSSVSHAMARLEDVVGHPLVEWKGRRLLLTPEGSYLQEVCERVFGDLDRAGERLERGHLGPRLRVTLGVTVEFGTTVLLRRVRPLLEAHPELHVDFHFSHDLVAPLLQGELDLAVDCRPHLHPSVERTELFRETWSVVASPDLLRRHPVERPSDLEDRVVLSMDREATWWRNFVEALCPPDRPTFRRVMALNHVRGIIHAAVDGLGVGLVPSYAVAREVAARDLVVLFPTLHLLEDRFCVYEVKRRVPREGNRLVREWLHGLDFSPFGDAP